jgi:hypothetical protein
MKPGANSTGPCGRPTADKKAATLIWSKLEQAGINMEPKADEARGWRDLE